MISAQPAMLPQFIIETPRGVEVIDPFSRLVRDRVIFVGETVDGDVANSVMAQLLILESEDSDKDITLYLNSPGGDIDAVMALYDTMQYVRPEVSTLCLGYAGAAAAVLLAAGAPGKRLALVHSRIEIGQPSGSAKGQAADVQLQALEIVRLRHRLCTILAQHSGQDVDDVTRDTDRDLIMTASQARAYGLIDDILTSRHPQVARSA